MPGEKQKITGIPAVTGIDRDSYEPAYIQLVKIFKDQVAGGVLRSGDRLPSESKICKQYKVSPMTVRRAINILVDQGVVDTAQGRGTFVRPIRLETASFQLVELQEIINDPHTSVNILEARIISADKKAALKLELTAGDRIIYIRRLISRGPEPLLYQRECLIYDPARPVVESELEVTSLRGLLKGDRSSDFKFGEISIETTVINSEESDVLKAKQGDAAFNLEHIFYDYREKPVNWGWLICRGDRLKLTSTLGIRNGKGG